MQARVVHQAAHEASELHEAARRAARCSYARDTARERPNNLAPWSTSVNDFSPSPYETSKTARGGMASVADESLNMLVSQLGGQVTIMSEIGRSRAKRCSSWRGMGQFLLGLLHRLRM